MWSLAKRKRAVCCHGPSIQNRRRHRQCERIDTATIAFGQGISVTAVQLISAFSAIANQGMLMQPYIVQK